MLHMRARTVGRTVLTAVILALSIGTAPAVAYPERPVNIIVAWPAGGATDLVARAMQGALADELGTDIVVRNTAGAAGTIGTADAAQAAADGYTVLISPPGPLTIQPHLRDLPYDVDDFEPVARIIDTPMVVMVPPDSPYQSVEALVEAAKAEPNAVSFASTGAGTLPQISMIALSQSADIELRHVPFQGSGEVMRALLGGVVDVFSDQAQLVPRYELHPIGVWADERLPEFPDTPTFKELGHDHVFSIWLGVFVPRGTPEEVIATLQDAFEGALEVEAVQQAFEDMRLQAAFLDAEGLAEVVEADYETNRELLIAAGLKEE